MERQAVLRSTIAHSDQVSEWRWVVNFITQMQAHIENLVKLQSVELERARVAREAKALPAQIAQAQSTLSAAQQEAAATSDALIREETLRTRLEREIIGHRQKAARLRVQLDAVTTPAQAEAIEHEVGFAETEISRLEAEEFTSLERSEALEVVLATARAQVEVLNGALDKTKDRVAASQQDLIREQAVLQTQREALRPLIDADLLIRFDRLSKSRGTGLARVDHMQCTGCRMGIRAQTWNQLREEELLACDSCGRILYWDSTMEPLPKSTQGLPGHGAAAPAVPKPHRVSN